MTVEDALLDHLTPRLDRGDAPLVVGLCGAQGSGKSTLAAAIARRIERTVVLSIDDLYLSRFERRRLARTVHPLFATRGVPGTHDVALGIETLDALRANQATPLPRFDKARDDRLPRCDWPSAPAGARLILFEGWCVGARPLDPAALAHPINGLERDEDPDGVWRRAWNDALSARYPTLFARIDHLVLLAAPSWEVVPGWRREQEDGLKRTRRGGNGLMDESDLARFVAHYERLTRHILAEMPGRADLVLSLDERRCLIAR